MALRKNLLINFLSWVTNAWALVVAHIYIFGGFYGFKNGSLAYFPAKLAFPSLFLFSGAFLVFLLDRPSASKLWVACFFRKISSFPEKKALFFIFLLTFLFISAVSLTRYYSLGSDAYDLGLFATAVWNASQGAGLFSSLKGNVDLLSDHFEPVLYLFSPLFYIWKDAAVLLVAQALLLASSVFPIYWVAREKLRHHGISLAIAVSFVLSRTLKGIYITDFYPECLLVPIFAYGIYFLTRGKKWIFFGLVLLALGCKEDLAFTVAGLGIFVFFVQKEKAMGALLFFIGIASWLITTRWIIPYFHPDGIYRYVGRLPFGSSYLENLKTVVFSPWKILPVIFTPPKLSYLLETLAPVFFLPLLGAAYFLPALPGILINLLSNYWKQASVSFHYGSRIIPFTYFGTIWGLDLLAKKSKDRDRFLSTAAAALVLWTGIFISVPDSRQFSKFFSKIEKNKFEKIRLLREIPVEASLCASYFLVPQACLRRYIYSWEQMIGGKDAHTICEYVAIDRKLSEWSQAQWEANIQKLISAGYEKIAEDPKREMFIFRNASVNPEWVRAVKGDPV